MRTPRLILASVLAALLALGAWYAWQVTNSGDTPVSHADSPKALADSPKPPAVGEEPARLPEKPVPASGSSTSAPFFAHRQEMERRGYATAAKSVAEARADLAKIALPEDRLLFLRGMFTRLGEVRTPELVEVFKSLSDRGERHLALLTLVELWNPAALAPAQNEELFAQYGPEGQYLAQMADDPLALALARTLPRPGNRAALFAEFAWREVARNPALALSYGEGLDGEMLAAFRRRVVGRWAQLDGAAAWAWTLQQPDAGAMQMTALGAMDPASAAQQLPQLSGDARAQGFELVAARWGESDTLAALNWANAIPNAQEKDLALASIHKVAPVGIGAVLTMNEEGYPVIRDRVPGGGAIAVPQLAEGATIAAVRDAQGNAIDLKGRKMEEVVSFIRGAPGTMLTMEVIPPGSPPGSRQVVIVRRGQLLFKQ